MSMSTIALCLVTLSLSTAALAQGYPSRPVRVINAYAPGGPNEVVARPIVDYLSKTLGQQFFIESKPGANGNIGAMEVVRAAPDGYTLLFGTTSQLTINPALYKMPFDSIKDLAPIVLVAQNPSAIILHPSFPASTVKELIAYAKANPGKLIFSSAGNGSQNHLAGELLAMLTQTKMLHVPYKGGGPALAAVLSGEVQLIIQSPGLSLGQVRAGKLKVLGISAPKRMAALPDVPTNKEFGLPEFKSAAGTGFLAPAKTARPIIDRLNAEIVKFLDSPQARAHYVKAGVELTYGSPEDFSRTLREELARWAKVVKVANIKIQ